MKAKFGIESFAKHAPKWLVPTLAGTILIIGVAQFLVTGDPAFSDELKLRINHYLTGFGMLVSGLAPLFGVDLNKKEDEKQN